MTHFDVNGAQIVCTSTREERMAQDDLPPVHFVQHDVYCGSDD